MQKSVIYFKRTLPEKVIQLLVSISNDAFNNREGKIVGNRESTYCLSSVAMKVCMAVCN